MSSAPLSLPESYTVHYITHSHLSHLINNEPLYGVVNDGVDLSNNNIPTPLAAISLSNLDPITVPPHQPDIKLGSTISIDTGDGGAGFDGKITPIRIPTTTLPNSIPLSFHPSTLTNSSALILLNRPWEWKELTQLWCSSIVRVIIDGAVNRLFAIHNTATKIPISLDQLPEIDFSILGEIGIERAMVGEEDRVRLEDDPNGQDTSDHTINKVSINAHVASDDNNSQRTQFDALLNKYNITITPLFPQTIPPDLIIGDLDSSHPLILYYVKIVYGTRVFRSYCQETTDFQKGLIFLSQFQQNDGQNDPQTRQNGQKNEQSGPDGQHNGRNGHKTSRLNELIHPRNLQQLKRLADLSQQSLSPITQGLDYQSQQQQPQQLHQSPQPQPIFNPPSPTFPHLFITHCLCYNSFGGRYDQYMANVGTLHSYSHLFQTITLLGDGNIVQLLPPLSIVNLDAFGTGIGRGEIGGTGTTTTTMTTPASSSSSSSQQQPPYRVSLRTGPHQKKVYSGVIPHMGPTMCSWIGLEWDLGEEECNMDVLSKISTRMRMNGMKHHDNNNRTKTKMETKESEAGQIENKITDSVIVIAQNGDDDELFGAITTAISSGVECGFGGLVSTNNWLKPVVTQDVDAKVRNDLGEDDVVDQHLHAMFLCDKPVIVSLSYSD